MKGRRMAKRTEFRENKKIPANKLVSCKEFRKRIKKSDDIFVFPLPFPMRVGEDSLGNEIIATHCVLKNLDENLVECCFCWINEEGSICLINMKVPEAEDLLEPKRRELIN